MFGKKTWLLKVRNAALEERNAALVRELDRARHDYEVLNIDFKRLVETLGNQQGGRPLQRLDFELDPYREDNKLPDQWMSPESGEALDIQAIETTLSPEELIPDGNG